MRLFCMNWGKECNNSTDVTIIFEDDRKIVVYCHKCKTETTHWK